MFTDPTEPGVAVVPESLISDALKAQVALVLAEVPADKTGAIVGIKTARGGNLAFAYRINGVLQVAAWVGKSGWDQPIDRGVAVKWTFGRQ